MLQEYKKKMLKYGDNYNYSLALSQDYEHYLLKSCDGAIPYFLLDNYCIALGNPVSEEKNYGKAADEFVDYMKKQRKEVLFFSVFENFAGILEKKGYFCNQVGDETFVHLGSYDFSGKTYKKLREASHNAARKGYKVNEVQLNDNSMKTMETISAEWLKSKKYHEELSTLLGRLAEIKLKSPRIFFLYKEDIAEGFMVCYPYYKDNKPVGYFADIIRHFPYIDKWGPLELLMTETIMKLKSENVKEFSLGWNVLFIKDKEFFRYSFFTRMLFLFFFNWTNFFFPFKKLAHSKNKYHMSSRNQFLCTRLKYPILVIYKTFKRIGVL